METLATELHKSARRNYPRRRVKVLGLNDLWQADLVEMQPYSRENKGYRYMLTCIDVLSKFAWAIPVRSKTGKDVTKGFREILKSGLAPKNLQVDRGKEFYNAEFKALMKRYGINMYSSHSELKASVVERFNRTLKTVMWKQFTRRGSYKWVNDLQDLVDSYNNTVHSTIRTKPADVTKDDEARLLELVTPVSATLVKPKFKVDDKVRISKAKKVFDKGYLQNWTNEIFVVSRVRTTTPVTYELKDSLGEAVEGTFYEQELQKTNVPDLFLVEKIIRKKRDKDGKMKYFVRWKGYDSRYDSWTDDVTSLS